MDYQTTINPPTANQPTSNNESNNGTRTTTMANAEAQVFRLYKERWFVVAIVSLLQLTNGALWVSFAPAANLAASYYNTSLDHINWLATVCFITDAVFSLPAMWVINKYGLKSVIYLTGLSNFIGSMIKLFGTFNFVSLHYRYVITLIGQAIASLGFPLMMCAPTAVSQHWFPDSQRVYSTAICTLSSAMGSALASLLIPTFTTTPAQVATLNEVLSCLVAVVGISAVAIRRSNPLTPPSVSASLEKEINNKDFLNELKQIFSNKSLVILIVCGGGLAVSIPIVFTTLLQQFLCSWGYQNKFAGLLIFLCTSSGAVMSSLLSHLAERATKYEEILKISLAVGNVFFCAVILIFPLSYLKILLIFLVMLYGASSISAGPLVLELGVETGYPVNEGIIGNFVFLFGNMQAAILVPISTFFARPVNSIQSHVQTCTVGGLAQASDLTYTGLFILGVNSLLCLVLIIFCKTKYTRKMAENINKKNSPQEIPLDANYTNNT